MSGHIENRLKIVDTLRKELVGPDPNGKEFNPMVLNSFEEYKDAAGPFYKVGSEGEKQEILQSPPKYRYGVGVIYPAGRMIGHEAKNELENEDVQISEQPGLDQNYEEGENDLESEVVVKERIKLTSNLKEKTSSASLDPNDVNDIGLNAANAQKPSSIAVSFFAQINSDMNLVIKAEGGRYRPFDVNISGKIKQWWLREPIGLTAVVKAEDLLNNTQLSKVAAEEECTNLDGLDLQIEVYARAYPDVRQQLITVCLVNRTNAGKYDDESIIFQAGFSVKIASETGAGMFLPYPGPAFTNLDEEEQSLELLYRNEKTYAVGHGCAANWEINSESGEAVQITAECFPCVEVPSTTPDIRDENGVSIEISMALLSGLIQGMDGFDELECLADAYETWILQKKKESGMLEPHFQGAAEANLKVCSLCLDRIREGIQYLKTNPKALQAFRLANLAVLMQQIRSRRKPRKAFYDENDRKIYFAEPHSKMDLLNPPKGKGRWRAFQIAFILMTVKSTSEGSSADRQAVELIWFPTGGGKTEAYLGLSAFSMFLRRLRDPDDIGTDIIMRYTLRLLTTQQFQRACSLICAAEFIRRQREKELGKKRFSIGLWVGSASTPNTRKEAVSGLKKMRTTKNKIVNSFVVDRCPWCGAEMGPLKHEKGTPQHMPKVIGYEHIGDTVLFRCPDPACDYSEDIPVLVIDEDIYVEKPSMIIGTVDKFALLSWKPEIRSLFGIAEDGSRELSPPNLIIQDELHLISGPLGSMVGLFEGLIEELCTDRRKIPAEGPKIVSSTATIRRYVDQIKGLYARDTAYLFPPPGIESSDSFFAKYAVNPDGSLMSGRIYIGVNSPAFGSMQTAEVRTAAALLQSVMLLPENERDPWWTLLMFFNSLRELGPALSLMESDIPDYQKTIVQRLPKEHQIYRPFWQIKELTGRLNGEEIPEAISELEVKINDEEKKPIDACLASNILEVGIDIDRLSLMMVVGQPISTSRYIQVTGRVGRSWWERPGLIVTIFSPAKPRDRSHFEKFKTYHQKLYAQVEPSSVTPFSPPALERSLHALMVSYVRQFGNVEDVKQPNPVSEDLLEELRELIKTRIQKVNPTEEVYFDNLFKRRLSEWKNWQSTKWSQDFKDENPPLLYLAGQYVQPEHENVSWKIQLSMRNVDAECREEIILPYFKMR